MVDCNVAEKVDDVESHFKRSGHWQGGDGQSRKIQGGVHTSGEVHTSDTVGGWDDHNLLTSDTVRG